MWFAQTLRVLSRLITSRTFLVSLCLSKRTSPVPRSFHSDDPLSNRKSLALLRQARKQGRKRRRRTAAAAKKRREWHNTRRARADLDRDRVDKERGDAHLENHILILLMRLRIDLLSEPDDGLKVHIGLLFLSKTKQNRISRPSIDEWGAPEWPSHLQRAPLVERWITR